MKLGLIFSIFTFFLSLSSYASQCSSLFELEKNHEVKREAKFENGHNQPLRNVMLKMKEYEDSIREFVGGLTPKNQSIYLKDNSAEYRNPKALAEILEIAYKYEKILSHLVEHSDHMMMSPRIQSIPAERREAFIQGYKQAYVDYLETFHRLVENIKSYEGKDPATWNNEVARDLLMEMHSQMGAAHNKF